MSKHSPTFLLVAMIAGSLIFCGVTGFIATMAEVIFPLFLVLFLIAFLSGSYKSAAALRITQPPFTGRP
jgi:uncharacterized membrane protein YtjA (UPF0391 family)